MKRHLEDGDGGGELGVVVNDGDEGKGAGAMAEKVREPVGWFRSLGPFLGTRGCVLLGVEADV
jgi:hypothetical protein